MVDRPRDRAQGDRAASPEVPGQIGGRDVLAYLRRHPDFLTRHPEALSLLRGPVRELGEGVQDFQHFQIERLRHELARVTLEHRTLLAASRGNLASQGRTHKAALAILSASSFEQLLQVVTTDLAVLLDVDVVTIGVENAAAPPGRLGLHGIHLLSVGQHRRAARRRAERRCCKPTRKAIRRCSAARPGWCGRRRCCVSGSAAARRPVCCASGPASPGGFIPGSAPNC